MPADTRPALLRVTERLAGEFPAVPPGAVMRVVLTCWRDLRRVADVRAWDRAGTSTVALVEDTARMRLRHRSAEAARAREAGVPAPDVGGADTPHAVVESRP